MSMMNFDDGLVSEARLHRATSPEHDPNRQLPAEHEKSNSVDAEGDQSQTSLFPPAR